MRSLHDVEKTRIFRFQDFNDEADVPRGRPGTPFMTFTDEDFYYADKVQVVQEISGLDPPPVRESVKTEMTDVYKDAVSAAGQIRSDAELKAKNMLDKSLEESEKLVKEAETKALEMQQTAKDEGFKAGYEEGQKKGISDGTKKGLEESKERYEKFFAAVDEARASIDTQKHELMEQHLNDLTELACAIAEKIICVSLETSGEVIKKMVLQAAHRAEEKQWAKVMLSASDIKQMRNDGIDIGGELKSVSDKIELIIVDDAEPGTCLVEFPEQVIDAGAAAQLQNIREMLSGADSE